MGAGVLLNLWNPVGLGKEAAGGLAVNGLLLRLRIRPFEEWYIMFKYTNFSILFYILIRYLLQVSQKLFRI